MTWRPGKLISAVTDAVNRIGWGHIRRKLFFKYVALFLAFVSVALLTNGVSEIWFFYKQHKASLVHVQREQAEAAAAKIAQFIKEIESQIGWTTELPWSTANVEQRRFDALRLMRQVPAITELAQLDGSGREQLRISRIALDAIESLVDFSKDPKFTEALAHKVYYGPVYFRRESEPYMTLSIAGMRRDAGVTVAEVNLKLIWDVVSQIKVGEHGKAFLVDARGRLIADPDISLVLRNTDLSSLMQVKAARAGEPSPTEGPVKNLHGHRVLTSYAPVTPLGWIVFVELPMDEAYAPLYASMMRTGALLAVDLLLAVIAGLFLARRLVVPIQNLRTGAARIGGGDLGQRISIKTGDELEALGDQFNSMAAQLQESYRTLEQKVEQRTRQLELANTAKSRFLAVASHDLRQPLHALGLFLAQLRAETNRKEQDRLLGRIEAAVTAMNELFNALLDISKLDAGVLVINQTDFPIARLLGRIEATFAETVREKGLQLRIVSSSAWVRSDFILLERILLNLVSNAARYTEKGGIVVGCRHRGALIRVDVYDTGVGIPENQQHDIFSEFYQVSGQELVADEGGLGLGLSIVERLGRLLGHPIGLVSRVGRGSRFSITIPSAEAAVAVPASPSVLAFEPLNGKFVLIIDDDELIRDSMRSLLQGWGCRVVTVGSAAVALAALSGDAMRPDLIISDYRLANGLNGIAAIEQVRGHAGSPIPAFLITGDTAPERLRNASASGYQLLHKPVPPMTMRALVSRLLTAPEVDSGKEQCAPRAAAAAETLRRSLAPVSSSDVGEG